MAHRDADSWATGELHPARYRAGSGKLARKRSCLPSEIRVTKPDRREEDTMPPPNIHGLCLDWVLASPSAARLWARSTGKSTQCGRVLSTANRPTELSLATHWTLPIRWSCPGSCKSGWVVAISTFDTEDAPREYQVTVLWLPPDARAQMMLADSQNKLARMGTKLRAYAQVLKDRTTCRLLH